MAKKVRNFPWHKRDRVFKGVGHMAAQEGIRERETYFLLLERLQGECPSRLSPHMYLCLRSPVSFPCGRDQRHIDTFVSVVHTLENAIKI